MGASFFLLACSLPGNPDCREARLSTIVKVPTPDFCEEDPHRGSSLWNPFLGSSRYEGPRCQGGPRCRGPRCREALVAGGLRCRGPLLAGKLWPGGLRCRESLVAGRPSLGKHFRGVPQDSQFWVDFFGNYGKDSRFFFGVLEISKFWPAFQTSGASSWLVAGRPSLPGSPRCREALVAGTLPGGPRCREALIAGRPSLPGGPRAGRPPRCRESTCL